MEQFNALLAFHHLRSTAARREVFSILLTAEQPLSIGTIAKSAISADRTSIYRTIQLFIDLSIIEIIPFGWRTRYELSGEFKPHHHHLHCISCGKLVDIKTQELESLIESIATNNNFILTQHHIELAGLCERCKKNKQIISSSR